MFGQKRTLDIFDNDGKTSWMMNTADAIKLEIGPYSLLVPNHLSLEVEVKHFANRAVTFWKIVDSRFYFSGTRLDGLESFIAYTTKQEVIVESICVNNIEGVKYGTYEMPRTWIDWWFKKGDSTICIQLQSIKFPHTHPNVDEKNVYAAIINSINYKS